MKTIRTLRINEAAVFVELPAFERVRGDFLDDEGFRALQNELLQAPDAGDLITETGGLRKLRFADARRQKGKRGGLRVIYFWWESGRQFWLFTVYDKDTLDDLTPQQKRTLHDRLKTELRAQK